MESPQPMIVRFYKNQRRFIEREAKRMRISQAAVVRHYIDGYRIPSEGVR